MRPLEMWILQTSSARSAPGRAERAESQGWDGLAVTDSQNLAGDAWVALTAAAARTTTLKLGTGVTNPVTRHPAVTAAAAAGLAVVAGDRVTVGIGRGDSALAHLGRAPAPVDVLECYVRAVRAYLAGEDVGFDDLGFGEAMAPPVSTLGLAGAPTGSRLTWRRPDDSPVPVEVAASGPKVIASAARSADRVLLAVGADLDRLRWGVKVAYDACAEAARDPASLQVGAFLNVVAHPDVAVARRLARGSLTSVARFSVMHGEVRGPATSEQRGVLGAVHRAYDMNDHTRAGTAQSEVMTDAFVDGYAVVGPAPVCVERLQEIAALGVDKVVVIGVSPGSDQGAAAIADGEMARVLADLQL
jgi:5,10-methylenetetrahydromethanopterin reductase